MNCKECSGMGVFHAFSKGKCEECGAEIICPHMPCYKLCEECAKKLNKCVQCGNELEDK
jgi:hypothetical protein